MATDNKVRGRSAKCVYRVRRGWRGECVCSFPLANGVSRNDADASGVGRMVGQASRGVERPARAKQLKKNHLSRPKSRDVSPGCCGGCWSGEKSPKQIRWEGDSPLNAMFRIRNRRKCTVLTRRFTHVRRYCKSWKIISRSQATLGIAQNRARIEKSSHVIFNTNM